MKKIIECVPNFSEGNDLNVIRQITAEVEKIDGVKLLDVDPGKATNRTVVTFVGEPEPVIEAAFQAIKKASELIDMSKHTGEHPRMGATDVCPLIPVSGISMEETAEYAHKLGKRVGEELNLPIYMYEKAQPNKERSNLSIIRAGEYEGFFKKIKEPKWTPDYGPAEFSVRAGGTVIGARDFLIAYNINLNTTSTRLANSVAFDVREAGRVKREGNPITGKVVNDENGNPVRIPGKLKECKAIGWFIEEYGIAQISMNLTNHKVTPVHMAFDAVNESAQSRGLRVTGSELVGLIPLGALLEAGKHYLKMQNRSLGVSEEELIHIAVKSLGLDELAPFDPNKKIIEYQLRNMEDERLVSMTAKKLAFETASESPAPGGGSVSAYVGALGVALGTMVANLSANKRGWEDQAQRFGDAAASGQSILDSLLKAVDEDTRAFSRIMDAFALPKGNEAETQARTQAIEDATVYACEVPFHVMKTAHAALDLIEDMVANGNQNSITDGAVGSLCIQTAVEGAHLNVKINASGLKDKTRVNQLLEDANKLMSDTQNRVQAIRSKVNEVIGL
ncbi:MAG: glutamate formimidoyltransferase [Bacteroidetes bacterium]|nr:MAG: glutamate formimidoyltransferase [Bacteroidota bacterium]